jgi:hypothetical protein
VARPPSSAGVAAPAPAARPVGPSAPRPVGPAAKKGVSGLDMGLAIAAAVIGLAAVGWMWFSLLSLQ